MTTVSTVVDLPKPVTKRATNRMPGMEQLGIDDAHDGVIVQTADISGRRLQAVRR